LASAVMRDKQERWWGYVWDEQAAGEHTCPDGAMRYEACDSREAAEKWCREHEADVVTRYRALCAYEAGLPAAKREWLGYYRMWNADRAVIDSDQSDDPEEMARLWQEVYEQGG
jgi:hypothetical protein